MFHMPSPGAAEVPKSWPQKDFRRCLNHRKFSPKLFFWLHGRGRIDTVRESEVKRERSVRGAGRFSKTVKGTTTRPKHQGKHQTTPSQKHKPQTATKAKKRTSPKAARHFSPKLILRWLHTEKQLSPRLYHRHEALLRPSNNLLHLKLFVSLRSSAILPLPPKSFVGFASSLPRICQACRPWRSAETGRSSCSQKFCCQVIFLYRHQPAIAQLLAVPCFLHKLQIPQSRWFFHG